MEILVRKDTDKLIWTKDLSGLSGRVTIRVGKNELATLFENGVPTNFSSMTVNEIKFSKNKYYDLICASKESFLIQWGVGGLDHRITYRDWETKLDALIGLSGTVELYIKDVEQAYSSFGGDATAQSISDKVFPGLRDVFMGAAAEIIEKADIFGPPTGLVALKDKIIEKSQRRFEDKFAEKGLLITEGGIQIGAFTLDEEYLKKREEWEAQKALKSKLKDDLDVLEDIKDLFPGETPQPQVVEVYKCTCCGRVLNKEDRFCPSCGQKV